MAHQTRLVHPGKQYLLIIITEGLRQLGPDPLHVVRRLILVFIGRIDELLAVIVMDIHDHIHILCQGVPHNLFYPVKPGLADRVGRLIRQMIVP